MLPWFYDRGYTEWASQVSRNISLWRKEKNKSRSVLAVINQNAIFVPGIVLFIYLGKEDYIYLSPLYI